MKAIVNIYYIIVNSNQTFMPVSQGKKKKERKNGCIFLTHAVYEHTVFCNISYQRGYFNPPALLYLVPMNLGALYKYQSK